MRVNRQILAAAVVAIAAPWLLAWNVSPSSTFLNQALAVCGWGLLLWLLARPAAGAARPASPWREPGVPLAVGALALLAGLALLAWASGRLPASLALSPAALLLAAAATLVAGAAIAGRLGLDAALTPLAVGLLAGGVLSALVGVIQVFLPSLADGSLIAATALPGRASGNLRQPNHLSSLTLWALVGLLWLRERRGLPWPVALPLGVLLLASLVLTFSRTGAVGIVLLGLWAAVARGWSRGARLALAALPFAYAAAWWVLTHATARAASGAARFSPEGDVSSSRFAIWSDTWALIRQHPWRGVGFGDFNFAWTLTPFPQRPVAFFDHTHNLPLQFAVELGLPLAVLITGLLLAALGRAVVLLRRAADAPATCDRQAAILVVLLIAVHSLLEYPLWYAYFLLPTAFALGVGLGVPARAGHAADATVADGPEGPTRPASRAPGLAWMRLHAVLMLAVGVFAVGDYRKVVVIFVPPANAGPLADRIEAGKRSVFFAHHAHYAAATSSRQPSREMASFRVASHFLLDTRLMMAWTRAWHEAGDDERARHLADRLREFHNPASRDFVEDDCVAAGVPWQRLFPGRAVRVAGDEPPAPAAATPAAALPFQCEPPTRRFDYRDFR